ncbi:hypothetical protein SX4_1103 [Vibrio mimicus SX-4]|nr:hypothetical protein SX4_1103 [Vibrio mimicus SX-4]
MAFSYFDGHGADWVQAFTNAVLSHALLIVGDKAQSIEFYEKAITYQSILSEGDKTVFDSTFNKIPDPRV